METGTITYKGKKYPTRTLTILINDEETEVTIAPASLSKAMTLELMEQDGTEEKSIDEGIYYYVPTRVLKLSDKTIAAKHLDEKFELVIKKFRITYRVEVYIEADTEAEALAKFEDIPWANLQKKAEFVERVSIDEEEL